MRFLSAEAVYAAFILTGLVPCFAEPQPVLPVRPATPWLSVRGLDLSRIPSSEELAAAGQLGGPLVPTRDLNDKMREAQARKAFGEAIELWNRHDYPVAVERFRQYLRDFPDSLWAAEASLHIGCDATYNGRYSEAEAIFRQLISANDAQDHPGARILANKARQRLATLKVEQNDLPQATMLFQQLARDSHDWRQRTYAAHWLQRLARLNATRQNLLTCGSLALAYALEKEGRAVAAAHVRTNIPATLRGHSLSDLVKLAASQGYPLVAVAVAPSDVSELPLPAILHIGARSERDTGHYWILDKVLGDRVELFDPQSERRLNQTLDELSREWSGRALLFPKSGGVPGTRLELREMEQNFGGCCGLPRKEDGLGDPPLEPPTPPKDDQDSCSEGFPRWAVNVVNLNLFVTDTPLWYDPAIGPPVRITLSYNSQSAVAQYEPFGNKWQFNYASYLVVDTAGTVLLFMPDGRRDTFTPDGAGGYSQPFQVLNRLTRLAPNHFELRFPDDTVYVYQIPQGTDSQQPFLTEIRDAHDQKITIGYDADARLSTVTDAQSRVTTLSYNDAGLVSAVADPFGRSANFQYDADRNLVQCTDMGGYWFGYAYDQDVFLTAINSERGSWSFKTEPADGIGNGSDAYPPPGGTMYENYRITITNPMGFLSEYHYNGYSSYTWYVSPRDYRPWRSKFDNNFSKTVPRTSYYFDQMNSGRQGKVARVVYPLGDSIGYEYDSNTGNQTGISDAHGDTWSYAHNSMGRVILATDPNGTATGFGYAPNGVDLVSITNALGKVRATYDTHHDVVSVTDRLNRTATFTYNEYGQLTTEVDPLQVTNSYLYDAGNRLKEIQRAGQVLARFTYDAIGRIETYTDASGLTITNEFSLLDQVTRVLYPDGRFDKYVYSSCCPRLLDSVTDRGGRTTSFFYNPLKRLVQRIDPQGGLTYFEYDPVGNLTRMVDPNGNPTAFAYDLDNRLIGKTYADSKTVSFGYDEAGLLVTRTNARGVVATYSYDPNHDRITTEYSDATPAITNTFDKFRRLTRAVDGLGANTYVYDAHSRLLSYTGPWPNDTITYAYDVLDRATNVATQLGQSVLYSYDELDRLTQVGTPAGNYLYAYLGPSPLVRRLTRPNGSFTTNEYDGLGRLTLVSNQKGSGELIDRYAYGYSAQDLLVSEVVSNGVPLGLTQSEQITYSYNTLNQLTNIQPANQALAYDADGNLTSGFTPQGRPFNASYDAEDRLVVLAYSDAAGIACRTEYAYRADGGLGQVRHFTNGVLAQDTRLVADRFFNLQDRDGRDNSVLREYAWGQDLGGGIGGLLDLKIGPNRYSYLYDGKGNVTALLDNAQNTAATYAYEPFGELRQTAGALNQPMRFSTKRYDEATGLAYFGYRFYYPGMGTWLTRDPLPQPDNLRLYRFAGDNPVQGIDPVGLQEFKLLDPRTWSDPWKKTDDYGKALDPSKKGEKGATDLSCTQSKTWKKSAGALGGDEGGDKSSSTPPVKRGKPTFKNFPNK